MTVIAELSKPFNPSQISWRVGSTTKDKSKGMALAYIDSRDVMKRLDDVVGPENWQCSYSHAAQKTICDISILVDTKNGLQWVSKADGAGDSDIEAEKGAISDAFKRAAVKWGIGRYLYDLDSPWVKLDEYKAIAKDEYKRLEALLSGNLVSVEKKAAPMPDAVYEAARKSISDAKDMVELQTTFSAAYKAAKEYGDQPAITGLTKVKDIKKTELEGVK